VCPPIQDTTSGGATGHIMQLGASERAQQPINPSGSLQIQITPSNSSCDKTGAPLCGGCIAADDEDHPGPHMLSLADHLREPLPPVIAQEMGGIFEPVRRVTGVRRRHRWRQIDQPPGIDGEPAHHLQRRSALLFTHHNGGPQARVDRLLPQDLIEVKPLVSLLLGGARIGGGGQEWPDGLGIDPSRRNRHECQLRIPQRRQLAAEDAAGVDIDRAGACV
jgi:hypothetical protein